jgi:hypothetical protein
MRPLESFSAPVDAFYGAPDVAPSLARAFASGHFKPEKVDLVEDRGRVRWVWGCCERDELLRVTRVAIGGRWMA